MNIITISELERTRIKITMCFLNILIISGYTLISLFIKDMGNILLSLRRKVYKSKINDRHELKYQIELRVE